MRSATQRGWFRDTWYEIPLSFSICLIRGSKVRLGCLPLLAAPAGFLEAAAAAAAAGATAAAGAAAEVLLAAAAATDGE